MRWICPCLAFAILAGPLSGCGGSSSLEKPPAVKAAPNPETDMPGYKEMQEQLKTGKKR